MRRPLPPIHLNTLSGYRCGVGRTAKQSQIVPAYFWLVTIITLYIQKQNIKFVKIFRCSVEITAPRGGASIARERLLKVYNCSTTLGQNLTKLDIARYCPDCFLLLPGSVGTHQSTGLKSDRTYPISNCCYVVI